MSRPQSPSSSVRIMRRMIPRFSSSRLVPAPLFRGWIGLALACVLVLVLPAGAVGADGPQVLRIRHFSGPQYTRVVLDLDSPASFVVREVEDPRRIAVNVRRGSFRLDGSIPVGDGLVKRIRSHQGPQRAQVVIDLMADYTFKSFSLPAADGRPERIVVDVYRPQPGKTAPAPQPGDGGVEPSPSRVPGGGMRDPDRPFTVIIDPGHGGLDPGAIRNGVQEKDIVLDVSLAMARLLEKQPGYRVVLTRDRDFYPSLDRRVEIARQEQGDLFISVHCNTARNRGVKGMEAFFLSLQGATDREAQELADKENAADMVGLAVEARQNDLVMNILMDLQMSRVLHESSRFCEHLLEAAHRGGVVARRRVKQARFQVLSSLAMPSALVELGFMSNQKDFASLQDPKRRSALAGSLVEGILSWRRDREALARMGKEISLAWTQQYAVRRGDSLWDLARKHGTTVGEITKRNNLGSRSIMVGQVLTLPDGTR
jgi:N-acetylmuramoyl-L-alanine amidase